MKTNLATALIFHLLMHIPLNLWISSYLCFFEKRIY